MKTIYRLHRAWLTLCSTLWNRLLMLLSGITCGSGFRSCGRILFRNYARRGAITLGHNVSVNSCGVANPVAGQGCTMIICTSTGRITIGDRVGLSNCTIFSSARIAIGHEACIGAGCCIYDTDFHSSLPGHRLGGNVNVPSAPVVIGERAFLGSRVTVLKGVTIGREAVVGAGSVVTKNIPDREVWAGNPARFIKRLPEQ